MKWLIFFLLLWYIDKISIFLFVAIHSKINIITSKQQPQTAKKCLNGSVQIHKKNEGEKPKKNNHIAAEQNEWKLKVVN